MVRWLKNNFEVGGDGARGRARSWWLGGCALAVVGRRVAAETAALLGRGARGMQPDFRRDVCMGAKEPKKSVPAGGGTSALTPALEKNGQAETRGF